MRPENYIADSGLVDACNVALLLGQPLLLTGEPGTGKTQFAFSMAWELGFGDPLKFETKSTSTVGDLFYHYDTLKRFQDAQSGVAADSALPYLTYNALGTAVLHTHDPQEVADYLPDGFNHPGKTRSVVLIDEIDKAPRDFPNDMLNELEQLYFRVPELGGVRLSADPNLQPVIIITSNSEKDLPDAFLRRCIYYNIPFPPRDRLTEIVTGRLGAFTGGSSLFLDQALDLFYRLRAPANGLRKKPATAELLGWLLSLQTLADGAENPLTVDGLAERTLSNLVKTAEDQARAVEILQIWLVQQHSG
jgi:MoxR-like ATPase